MCKFDLNSTLCCLTAISCASNRTCNKRNRNGNTEEEFKQCYFLSLDNMKEIASLSQLWKKYFIEIKTVKKTSIFCIRMFLA